jgi:hypothetical protein
MKVHNSVWQQKVLNSTNSKNWQMPGQIICDCPRFLKKYSCKHCISLAVRSGFIVIPLAGKNVIIGQKPKLSGHTLAKKALLTQ